MEVLIGYFKRLLVAAWPQGLICGSPHMLSLVSVSEVGNHHKWQPFCEYQHRCSCIGK